MTESALLSADTRLDADWWRQAVVYQVYPRSFADSNADGIGDIAGLTISDRLPRGARRRRGLAQPVLPVGAGRRRVRRRRLPQRRTRSSAPWTTSTRWSPRRTRSGIKVIVDIVPNHTSDLHPWFVEALASEPGSPARDRYIFRDGTGADGSAAAVRLDLPLRRPAPGPGCPTAQWYCHLFAPEQPDLNWDNPEVRDDFKTTLRFWADRGVDGYRVDVAHALAKDLSEPLRSKPTLEDEGVPLDGTDPLYDRDEVHEIYAEWREVFDSYDPPRTAVAEACAPSERRALYARPTGLGQAFNFDLLKADYDARDVPRRHHVLPERGDQDRLVLDLGAVQPRRRPARLPLRPARRASTTTSG